MESSKCVEAVGSENDRAFNAVQPMVRLLLKWSGKSYKLQMELRETVEDLRSLIELETGVRPKNQKIFGLRIKGRDGMPLDATIAEFNVRENQVIKMMGSCDDTIEEIEAELATLDDMVMSDFDVDTTLSEEMLEWQAAAQRRLLRYSEKLNVNIMNQPREGKKLLVLDLDHTLLDFSSKHTSSMEELKRPFMDDFLTACHKHYDLVVWSQTKWHWIEIKLTEMGMVTHPQYSICFALDKSCMFKVTRPHKGKVRDLDVKALELIWKKFPQWSPKNTVHIDDLARNFALNPQSGLTCTAYRRKRSSAASDRELLEIAAYLEVIAEKHDDFTTLNHKSWRTELERHIQEKKHSS